ncbi:MAG: outer membrane lipoprotein chaperone LolA [Gammaproteobacteria bacterium]|nr:outer membrane lipoprotein chaperone LolA [Gammaproteobacteria bacterium]
MRYALLTVFLWLTAVSPAVAAELARFFTHVHTMAADFHQVVRNRHGTVVSRGNGRMWLARPGRFRWNYDHPYHEQIIGQGRTVWLYEPGLAQATRYSLDRALGRTPALLLAGEGNIGRLFHARPMGQRHHLQWVRLTPRGRGQGFRWIEVGYNGVHVRRLNLADDMDQITDIRFTHIRINRALASSLFEFVPPPHTAIVRP